MTPIDWPTAVAFSSTVVSTGGVIVTAILKYNRSNNNGNGHYVRTDVCNTRYEVIAKVLTRVEESIDRVHERIDQVLRER